VISGARHVVRQTRQPTHSQPTTRLRRGEMNKYTDRKLKMDQADSNFMFWLLMLLLLITVLLTG